MTNIPSEKPASLEAISLTAEELLRVITAGHPVLLADGTEFCISDETQRHVLQFFTDHRIGHLLYRDPIKKGDENTARSLLSWLEQPFNPPEIQLPNKALDRPLWRIQQVCIHQFGGLHPYCLQNGATPPPFVINFERDLVLVRGQNAAGKSAISKAITFMLTGRVPRTIAEPCPFQDLLNIYKLPHDGEQVELPTIVPMPTAEQWNARRAADLPTVDTAVDVTFAAPDGRVVKVRRQIVSRSNGKFTSRLLVDGTPFDGELHEILGVSRLSLELSVIHPARLPIIQLGQPEELGRAVQELTGLRPVGDLASGTMRILSRYLVGAFTGRLNASQDTEINNFCLAAAALADQFKDSPSKPPPAPSLAAGEEERCRERLKAISDDLEKRSREIRSAVAKAAGVAESDVRLENLDDVLNSIRFRLSADSFPSSGFAALVDRLASLDDDVVEEARKELTRLLGRANRFAQNIADQAAAVRRRLYARVTAWLVEEGHDVPPNECPVCFRPLTEAEHDHSLDLSVAEAIKQGQAELEDLQFTLEQFIEAVRKDLWTALPDSVRPVLKQLGDLDFSRLKAHWKESVVDNIIESTKESPTISKLIMKTNSSLLGETDSIPEPTPFKSPDLSTIYSGTSIESAVTKLSNFLSLVEWAKVSSHARASTLARIYGTGVGATTAPNGSLVAKIDALKKSLCDYEPVKGARSCLTRMEKHFENWLTLEKEKRDAAHASEALRALQSLKAVVDAQVGGMLIALSERSNELLNDFYRPTGSCEPNMIGLDHDGSALISRAEHGGVEGDGAYITNSSRQRAQLFSFVLALTEHVWHRDGGVRQVLLDDIQNLFDENNQKRLAEGLIKRIDDGFAPIVLSFDRVFVARVARAGNLSIDAAVSDKVSRWNLVPRDNEYSSAHLEEHEDQLIISRRLWESSKSRPFYIQQFCAQARIFIEQSLVTFLNETRDPVHNHLTLDPLAARVRQAIKGPAFNGVREPFERFLARLPDGQVEKRDLAEALNWSHHFQADELVQRHAEAVHNILDDLLEFREQCIDVLEGRARIKRNAASPKIISIPLRPAPTKKISVIGTLAASDSTVLLDGADQRTAPVEIDSERHTTFVVGSASKWLPVLISPRTVLITESCHGQPLPEDLTVVWDTVTGEARPGWCKVAKEQGELLLSGYAGRFQKSYALNSVEIQRVVGLVFRAGPDTQKPCEPVELPNLLDDIAFALEVAAGDSAEPLVRRGDKSLVGVALQDSPLKATLAPAYAFRLNNGEQLLKRAEPSKIPGHLQLLPLGESGSGAVVALDPGSLTGAPAVECVHPVMGFWRG